MNAAIALLLAAAQPAGVCVPEGRWADAAGRPAAADAVLARAAASRFVLLGERHATPAHHRWQASVTAALLARGRPVVIGLEQLPREAQGALDAWVAGRIDEATFLTDSRWAERWGHDFAAYRPLFELARAKRVPMAALNIDRMFVRRVAREGYDAAAAAGAPVGRPAPAPEAYAAMLRDSFAAHGGKASAAVVDRFIAAQTVWDRAMAEAMLDAARRHPDAVVVGIMGAGHVRFGHGVAHQLRALRADRITSMLPAAARAPCDGDPGSADAMFGTNVEPAGWVAGRSGAP